MKQPVDELKESIDEFLQSQSKDLTSCSEKYEKLKKDYQALKLKNRSLLRKLEGTELPEAVRVKMYQSIPVDDIPRVLRIISHRLDGRTYEQ